MNWQDIWVFICLVEQRTLSAAAELLDVQHSTVARRIHQLEKDLGLRLFERIGKRYVLTVEGEHLYRQARVVNHEMMALQRMAVAYEALAGEVTVSLPPLIMREWITPHLAMFHRDYPDIVLHLRSEAQLSDLHHKQADIALRLLRPTTDDLLIRRVATIQYACYIRADAVPVKSDLSLMMFVGNRRVQAWIVAIAEQTARSVILSSNDFVVIKHAIQHGVGMGVLPSFMVSDDDQLQAVNPLTLQPIGLSQAGFGRENDEPSAWHEYLQYPLYLVMHPDVSRAARVRATADWLVTCCA